MPRNTFSSLLLLLATTACTTQHSYEVVLVPTPAAPLGEVAQVAPDTFGRTEVMRHEYTDERGHSMQVAVQFTYRADDGRAPAAAERVRARWHDAVEQARLVLQRADLTSEAGTLECEERLCGVLTETLFSDHDGSQLATIERVVWKRVTWI